jgi:hypothetical protein
MVDHVKSCHGQFGCLHGSSDAFKLGSFSKVLWKAKLRWIHGMWHLRTGGLWHAVKHTMSKLLALTGIRKKQIGRPIRSERRKPSPDEEVLNLKPGELVEVKSEQEILAMLDENNKYKGLLWMRGMRNFCGGRYRVYRRLERILLETNGELRQVKNTVLLEGVMCNGEEFYGCDRSCFHFWREAWLRRVKED